VANPPDHTASRQASHRNAAAEMLAHARLALSEHALYTDERWPPRRPHARRKAPIRDHPS